MKFGIIRSDVGTYNDALFFVNKTKNKLNIVNFMGSFFLSKTHLDQRRFILRVIRSIPYTNYVTTEHYMLKRTYILAMLPNMKYLLCINTVRAEL